MNCTVYSLFQFSYLHAFHKPNNITTKLNLKVRSYFQSLPNKTTEKYSPVYFCHATYAFQSESTLYSCVNVKELLVRSRREIWSLSDCNWTRTQNHLVRNRTFNHLAKWLGVCLRTKWFWVWVQLQSHKYSTLDPHGA